MKKSVTTVEFTEKLVRRMALRLESEASGCVYDLLRIANRGNGPERYMTCRVSHPGRVSALIPLITSQNCKKSKLLQFAIVEFRVSY